MPRDTLSLPLILSIYTDFVKKHDERAQASLLQMAQVWLRLAQEAERAEQTAVGLLSLLSEVTPYARHFAQNAAMVFVGDLLRQSFTFGRKAAVVLGVSVRNQLTVDPPRSGRISAMTGEPIVTS